METQEETTTPTTPTTSTSPSLLDGLNQRLLKLVGQAQSQFRTTGLQYSEKLHQYFLDLDSKPAAAPSEEVAEEASADPAPAAA